MCPGAEGAHWEPLSYSLGSRHCSTCPGWGMEGLWSWALPSRSQCSVIPTGECHAAAVVDVLLCMGWDWWCRCPGEPGASLDNSMPVSCSAKPMCPSGSLHSIHCIHIQQPQPSAACPQELTAHPEPPVLKAWHRARVSPGLCPGWCKHTSGWSCSCPEQQWRQLRRCYT